MEEGREKRRREGKEKQTVEREGEADLSTLTLLE